MTSNHWPTARAGGWPTGQRTMADGDGMDRDFFYWWLGQGMIH